MHQRTQRALVVLLSLNLAAVILLVVTVIMGHADLMPTAVAQVLDPAAKPANYVVTPAQLSSNTWGCYVVDTNTQSLCVYQYSPGEKLLRLVAARTIAYDTQLKNFNTLPQPSEVADLVNTERKLKSGSPATAPADNTGK